jgi:hypothetical protein
MKIHHMVADENEADIEEDHLRTEWIKACQEQAALQAELDKPTASRLYDAQVQLFRATEAAREKCALLLALRTYPKTRCNFY